MSGTKTAYNKEKNRGSSLPAAYQKLSVVAPGNGPSVRFKTASNPPISPAELKQKLSNLVLDIYLAGEERFTPMPPFVLVRVLPKDNVSDSGRIILPNQKQNKPVHEGIVLEVYKPYTEEVVLADRWTTRDGVEHVKEYIDTITRVCPLQPGQRVAYPHYEGVAHKYLGDDYVLVRHSADQIKFPYCQVLGIIDHEGDRDRAIKLRNLLRKYYSVTMSGKSVSRGA